MPSTDRWSVTFLVLLDHTIADPSQDAAVLLGHPDTLACVQLAVDKHSQVFLHQAAFQTLTPAFSVAWGCDTRAGPSTELC